LAVIPPAARALPCRNDEAIPETSAARKVEHVTDLDLEHLRRGLLARAFLYDDPTAYVRGVQDALSAVAALATLPRLPQDPASA
jgi:hypothetical protein